MKTFATASIVTFLFAAQPALAEEKLVTGADVDEILNIARGYGSALLEKDSQGDPTLRCKSGGLGFSVDFYGCKAGANCTSIQFRSGFGMDSAVSLETIEEWNSKMRWARASLDKDGDPVIRQDMMLSGGVSRQNLDKTFDLWTRLLADFAKHIGYRK